MAKAKKDTVETPENPIPETTIPASEESAAPELAEAPETSTSEADISATEESAASDTPNTVNLPATPKEVNVDNFIRESNMPSWKGAALCRAEGWAIGKRITREEFDAAVHRLENRRMGG